MMLELAMIAACGAGVAPETTQAIIRVESAGRPFALNVNRFAGRQPKPSSASEAARLAHRYIAAGYSVDIGLMQVNSRNLNKLGLSVEAVLDPCTNIQAGTTILRDAYRTALRSQPPGTPALQVALSYYNTGNGTRGFRNGYVARYYGPTNVRRGSAGTRPPPVPRRQTPRLTPTAADTLVYARAGGTTQGATP